MIKINNLLKSKKSISGRNTKGHLVCTHKGGGNKRFFRLIDFNLDIINLTAQILKIIYDPNRSSLLTLVCYKNGYLSYNLAYKNVIKGDIVINSNKQILYNKGDSLPLKYISVGTLLYNLTDSMRRKFIRSAGCFAKLLTHKKNFTLIQLKSKEQRLFNNNLFVNIGVVSQKDELINIRDKSRLTKINQTNNKWYKAGKSRNLGKRPKVRGVAKNPVDHPNGGTTKGGKFSKNQWGNLAKGGRSAGNSRYNKYIIVKRYNV